MKATATSVYPSPQASSCQPAAAQGQAASQPRLESVVFPAENTLFAILAAYGAQAAEMPGKSPGRRRLAETQMEAAAGLLEPVLVNGGKSKKFQLLRSHFQWRKMTFLSSLG